MKASSSLSTHPLLTADQNHATMKAEMGSVGAAAGLTSRENAAGSRREKMTCSPLSGMVRCWRRQARLRRRNITQPTPTTPPNPIAHVDGSGTAVIATNACVPLDGR